MFLGTPETLKELDTTKASSPSVETATPTVSLPSQTKDEQKEEEGATGNSFYYKLQYKCSFFTDIFGRIKYVELYLPLKMSIIFTMSVCHTFVLSTTTQKLMHKIS